MVFYVFELKGVIMADAIKKKPLSDDEKIAKAQLKLSDLEINDGEVLPNLLHKFGGLVYDFILLALASPQQLCERTALPFMSSKVLIVFFAGHEFLDDLLAKGIGKSVDELRSARAFYLENEARIAHNLKVCQNFSQKNEALFSERIKELK